ncbi:MAG: MerR family transcriptional regulator [Bacteroidota bacterium]
MQRDGLTDGIPRLYYSIREVSDQLDLEPHVLRYWESEFPRLAPRKNAAGRRVYTEENIQALRRIKELLKEDKYTLEGARQVLDREARGEHTDEARRDLRALRAFLANLRDQL